MTSPRSSVERTAGRIPTRHKMLPPTTRSADPFVGVWTAPTLLNAWVNFGGGYQPLEYMRDSFGFVHIRGMIKDGTTIVGTKIFTLPVGFWPALTNRLLSNETSGVSIDIDVETDGDVTIQFNSASTILIFDDVTFHIG